MRPAPTATWRPVARIAGSRTRLVAPSGIVIGPDGNIRVTDSGSVLTFNPRATGNVAPLSQLKATRVEGAPRAEFRLGR